MVLLQGTAPYSIGYQPIASLYCSRRKGRVFVFQKPKASQLNVYWILLSRLNIRLVSIVKRLCVSTKIFIADLPGGLCESLYSLSTSGRELKCKYLKGFVPDIVPSLNAAPAYERGPIYVRACVKSNALSHSFMQLNSSSKVGRVNTLTSNRFLLRPGYILPPGL